MQLIDLSGYSDVRYLLKLAGVSTEMLKVGTIA